MIISAEKTESFIDSLSKISDGDPFSCRIFSLYKSYSAALPFVDFWLTANDGNSFTGAIARNGTDFIVFLTEQSDIEEISSFMRVAGAASVICGGGYEPLSLYGYKITEGVIMERDFEMNIGDGLKTAVPDIKEAYSLIVGSADENFTPPPFDDFYVDVNHKLRHGTMRVVGLYDGDKLSAVAMTVAESDNGAVIGAVACDSGMRGRGYGSYAVNHITNELVGEGKKVYIHRAANANQAFYENLGFKNIDIWREYRFAG